MSAQSQPVYPLQQTVRDHTSFSPLYLDEDTWLTLLKLQGPSLGMWRAAEIAVLREQVRQGRMQEPVLDLGCGDGLVTSQVLNRVEIGLDPDTQAVAKAASTGIYTRFETVLVQDVALSDGSIGTVLSNSVLEHIEQIDAVLQRVSGLLRPGGRLICTMPTEAFSRWLLLPFSPYARWRNQHYGHLNLWTVEQWRAHLQAVGLEIEEVRPYMRHSLVWLWDGLELLQRIWIGRCRLFSIGWKRLTPGQLNWLAHHLSHLNLASAAPGGGRLIVAHKL
jgi:SAM-dependent methyltransferase